MGNYDYQVKIELIKQKYKVHFDSLHINGGVAWVMTVFKKNKIN